MTFTASRIQLLSLRSRLTRYVQPLFLCRVRCPHAADNPIKLMRMQACMHSSSPRFGSHTMLGPAGGNALARCLGRSLMAVRTTSGCSQSVRSWFTPKIILSVSQGQPCPSCQAACSVLHTQTAINLPPALMPVPDVFVCMSLRGFKLPSRKSQCPFTHT